MQYKQTVLAESQYSVDEQYSEKCPVEIAQELIGGKWKGVILFKLLEFECMCFSELKQSLPRVTQRMLTLQLHSLEADGLVERTVYPAIPPRVEYRLTELGQTLKPVINSLMAWGVLYDGLSSNQYQIN